MGNCGSTAAADVDGRAPAAKASTRTAQPEKATKSSAGAKAKKIDPKVNAAVAVQKHARAKSGRIKGAAYMQERAERACTCYRVNVKSDTFGVCFCGWPKAEHADDALRKGAANVSGPKRVGSSELRARMQKKDKVRCAKYVMNMEGVNFGECICGAARDAHEDAALDKERAKNDRRDSAELREKMTHRTFCACPIYTMDLQAADFGACTCGEARDRHTAAALAKAVRTSPTKGGDKAQEEEDLRERMTSRELADCPRFEVDMDPSAPFGQCRCGRPKAQHTVEALSGAAKAGLAAAKKRDDGEVRATMAARDVRGCEQYVLDMRPAAQFGHCANCGLAKAEHTDRAVAAGAGGVMAPPARARQTSKELRDKMANMSGEPSEHI